MCLTLSFLLLFLLFSFLSHISISHYTDSSFLFAFCFHLLILFSAYHLIVLFPLLFRHISFILYSWTPLFPFLALSFSSLFFFFFLIPLSHTHTHLSFHPSFLLSIILLYIFFSFLLCYISLILYGRNSSSSFLSPPSSLFLFYSHTLTHAFSSSLPSYFLSSYCIFFPFPLCYISLILYGRNSSPSFLSPASSLSFYSPHTHTPFLSALLLHAAPSLPPPPSIHQPAR